MTAPARDPMAALERALSLLEFAAKPGAPIGPVMSAWLAAVKAHVEAMKAIARKDPQ